MDRADDHLQIDWPIDWLRRRSCRAGRRSGGPGRDWQPPSADDDRCRQI
jgi:hypothetical protein